MFEWRYLGGVEGVQCRTGVLLRVTDRDAGPLDVSDIGPSVASGASHGVSSWLPSTGAHGPMIAEQRVETAA